MISLVLGGAHSGKSALAERLASRCEAPVTYVATAIVDPADADFARRVAAHRARRPSEWATVEAGAGLVDVLGTLRGSALVDSLGTWVAAFPDFEVDLDGLCRALVERGGDTIVVSDEVGGGVHPATEVGRRFRDALGTVNQAVAAVAGPVYLVVAGRALDLPRPEAFGEGR